MRHAVILSSFVPETEVARDVGAYYIKLLQERFSDCNIYVGINTGSSPGWRQQLARSGLNIIVCDVASHMQANSDVAGFQAVLRKLRTSRAVHDFYWFGHTKGATHSKYADAEALRFVIERDFWSRRNEIEERCDPVRFGAFPALPMPAAGPNREVVDYLRGIFPSLCPPVGYVSTYTFFGLTGVALRNFLASADDRFFERSLTDEPGLSRYFFEGGFSWIADMAGFEPYLLQKQYKHSTDDPALDGPGYPDQFDINQQRVARMIESWRTDRQGYDFQGWPVWVGGQIQLGHRLLGPDEFFRINPNYAPSLCVS